MPTKPRTKPPPQTTRDYLATLEHAIRQLSYGHHTFTIFRHFVELLAIALSNAADPINDPLMAISLYCARVRAETLFLSTVR